MRWIQDDPASLAYGWQVIGGYQALPLHFGCVGDRTLRTCHILTFCAKQPLLIGFSSATGYLITLASATCAVSVYQWSHRTLEGTAPQAP